MHLIITTGFPGTGNEGGFEVEVTRETDIPTILQRGWDGLYKGRVVRIIPFPESSVGHLLFVLCELEDDLKKHSGLGDFLLQIFVSGFTLPADRV